MGLLAGGGEAIEDTMGLLSMVVGPIVMWGGGAMEDVTSFGFRGGGYRKRQSSLLLLVDP